MTYTYTPEETAAFNKQALRLAGQINEMVRGESQPLTMGGMIIACAHLFASRAVDRDHAEKLGRDLMNAVLIVYDLKPEKS